MKDGGEPRLTALSHGGGCGCKISPGVLAELLAEQTALPVPEALLVGHGTSDDAAAYRLNADQVLVATTDFFMPIVDDPGDFGRIAATNALSDVYAMGARPIMALALVAMPVGTLSRATIRAVIAGGAEVCARAGIPVGGGHTIDSVEPIYGIVAMGIVRPEQLMRNDGARPGDVLILGKALGTGILASAARRDGLAPGEYEALIASTTALNTPGPDVAAVPGVHAMTDVTGFGLAGHALEMARGAGCDIHLDWPRVPLLPGAAAHAAAGRVTGAGARNWESYGAEVALDDGLDPLARALVTDPQTSGGLLVACAPDAAADVLALFHAQGFGRAAVIGRAGAATGAPRLRVTAGDERAAEGA